MENENGLKHQQIKAPLVFSESPVVHLRVLMGRWVFGAELQRLEEGVCVSIVAKRSAI